MQSRVLARSGGSSGEAELGELLVRYFERFGSKPSCALDLKLYLPSAGKDSIKKFFDQTLNFIELDAEKVPKSVSL